MSRWQKALLGLVTLLTVGTSAQAVERIRLNLDQNVYSGERIKLKKEINNYLRSIEGRRNHRHINLQDYNLVKVRIIGESIGRRYQAMAELHVARQVQDWGTLEWSDRRARRMPRLVLNNSSRRKGPWQIHMDGDAYVRRVVAVLEPIRHRPNPPRHPRLVQEELGSVRAEKIGVSETSFNLNGKYVDSLRITGMRSKVKIEEILVETRRGGYETLWSARGMVVREGEIKDVVVNQEAYRIILRTISPSLRGSRGRINVKAMVEDDRGSRGGRGGRGRRH